MRLKFGWKFPSTAPNCKSSAYTNQNWNYSIRNSSAHRENLTSLRIINCFGHDCYSGRIIKYSGNIKHLTVRDNRINTNKELEWTLDIHTKCFSTVGRNHHSIYQSGRIYYRRFHLEESTIEESCDRIFCNQYEIFGHYCE